MEDVKERHDFIEYDPEIAYVSILVLMEDVKEQHFLLPLILF